MKRVMLASCILLSGCYVDPNTGRLYPAQGYQYPQRQVLVYHYQVPPPNPYYQASHQGWQQPEAPRYQEEWRPPEAMPPVTSRLNEYYACAESNQERQFQQPQNCGAYLQ